ncbi:MAG: hypothetical protein KGM47_01825 [Acidobacteriota bacterium]|nr:hypothetical protein [Acidobacteriota bacterium]
MLNLLGSSIGLGLDIDLDIHVAVSEVELRIEVSPVAFWLFDYILRADVGKALEWLIPCQRLDNLILLHIANIR